MLVVVLQLTGMRKKQSLVQNWETLKTRRRV
jgi:hypothetical protein